MKLACHLDIRLNVFQRLFLSEDVSVIGKHMGL